MGRQLFVNLPVKDLEASISFFKALGLSFNKQFTDETATCLEIGEGSNVMLLTEEKFMTFTPKPIVDAKMNSEVLICFSCENKAEVEDLVKKAVNAGGTLYNEPKDFGFMFSHGFQDLDGHIWELVYMDMEEFAKQ